MDSKSIGNTTDNSEGAKVLRAAVISFLVEMKYYNND
jgi:hypothetical protein